MLATAYFLLYLFCGLGIVFFLLPRLGVIVRAWLGLCLGLILEMWLPALCAFFCGFTLPAQLWAMLPLFMLTGLSYLFRRDRKSVV